MDCLFRFLKLGETVALKRANVADPPFPFTLFQQANKRAW